MVVSPGLRPSGRRWRASLMGARPPSTAILWTMLTRPLWREIPSPPFLQWTGWSLSRGWWHAGQFVLLVPEYNGTFNLYLAAADQSELFRYVPFLLFGRLLSQSPVLRLCYILWKAPKCSFKPLSFYKPTLYHATFLWRKKLRPLINLSSPCRDFIEPCWHTVNSCFFGKIYGPIWAAINNPAAHDYYTNGHRGCPFVLKHKNTKQIYLTWFCFAYLVLIILFQIFIHSTIRNQTLHSLLY